eukprot:1182782-Pleurochrysis_carterae.AAC.1
MGSRSAHGRHSLTAPPPQSHSVAASSPCTRARSPDRALNSTRSLGVRGLNDLVLATVSDRARPWSGSIKYICELNLVEQPGLGKSGSVVKENPQAGQTLALLVKPIESGGRGTLPPETRGQGISSLLTGHQSPTEPSLVRADSAGADSLSAPRSPTLGVHSARGLLRCEPHPGLPVASIRQGLSATGEDWQAEPEKRRHFDAVGARTPSSSFFHRSTLRDGPGSRCTGETLANCFSELAIVI